MKIVVNVVKILREKIIKWYDERGQRELPWRSAKDPWAILVAAIMLRRTTTRQVLKVYREFIGKYPRPELLLTANIGEVKSLMRPLGLHHRVEQLVKLAEHIVKKFHGAIPCSREQLEELPSVGDYAVSEVLLAYCNEPEPLLDTNMIRVLARVLGAKPVKPAPYRDKGYYELAKSLIPRDPELARKFNYGILDFAREICTARKPKCSSCVLNSICLYAKGAKSLKERPRSAT